jgi:dipeptidyl aminopeptidase/acylaminoacyl peptidase
MNKNKLLKLTLFLILTPSLLSAGTIIPLRDFFRNPERASYSLSPDGNTLAFMAPYKNRMNIFIQATDLSKKEKRITTVTDRDISGFFWKENEHIVYARDFAGDENYHIFRVNIKTGKTKDLTPFKDVRASIVDDLEDISTTDMLIALNKEQKEVFDVYRLNIYTGELSLEVKNPGNITSWYTDHNGIVRAAATTDGVNNTFLYRNNIKENFKPLFTTSFTESFEPLFFTFDNKNIYALSNIGTDKARAIIYDPNTKKQIKTIYKNNEVDVSGLTYSKKRKTLTTARYYTSKLQRIFLDKEIKEVFNNIQKKLPKDIEISISSSNKNEDRFIIRTYSDKTLGSYYLYETNTDTITKLADLSPWLNPDQMASMEPIKFVSRDGLIINGYLTLPLLPSGVKPKNLPVVINPHGGPWARDTWGFDPEVQFLANRGYAVLQINFRGSTGYGKKFWKASFKQWGLKMQDDISDATKWLIKKGIADPKRIAIYGGSYGGYATLAGLTFTPDLYACGVDYVGVSNLFTFMKSIPPYWKPYLDMFYKMVGDPEKDKELLARTSPVYHADKIKVPLLIAQGAKDPRVNINESNQIVDALKKRGINVPYLVKDNEGHGFRNEENRFEFYEAMEKFLSECIGGTKWEQ